jgi:DUF1365 family protein
MAGTLTSRIYDCEVVHERLQPKRHAFRYRLFYLDLDLAELGSLSKKLLPFSHNRFNLYTFRDDDHLDLGKEDLRSNLESYLAGQGIELPDEATIRLVTLPRILGYIFNPVCFYFFFDAEGKPLHVLAEVCNTYREVKPYFIDSSADGKTFSLKVPKHFYVSPFTNLTTQFHFRIDIPGDQIEIHIDDVENDETVLLTWIRGEAKPLTNARLFWYSVRFPLLTLQVILKIHWQALRLWLKKLHVFPKKENLELQKDVLRPHSTLDPARKP